MQSLPRVLAASAVLSLTNSTADAVTAPAIVRSVPSIAALQALGAESSQYSTVNVTSYYAGQAGGGGIFSWSGTSTATVDGGTIIAANGLKTGRWLRDLLDSTVDVRQFGAKCDTSTNDHAAIQAAINYAASLNTGRVELPAGECVTRSPVLISAPIAFGGIGINGTTLLGAGLAAGQFVLSVDSTESARLEGVLIKDLTLRSNNDSPDLLKIRNASNSRFENVGLRNARNGIVITGSRTFSNTYDQVTALSALSGSTVLFRSYTGGGQHTFTGLVAQGAEGFVVDANSEVTGISLVSPDFEANTTAGMDIAGKVYGLSIAAPRTEANAGSVSINIDPVAGNFVYGLSILGGVFTTHAGAEAFAIQLGGRGGKVDGFNIAGNFAMNYRSSFVHLGNDAENGMIVGTALERVPTVVDATRSSVFVVNNQN